MGKANDSRLPASLLLIRALLLGSCESERAKATRLPGPCGQAAIRCEQPKIEALEIASSLTGIQKNSEPEIGTYNVFK